MDRGFMAANLLPNPKISQPKAILSTINIISLIMGPMQKSQYMTVFQIQINKCMQFFKFKLIRLCSFSNSNQYTYGAHYFKTQKEMYKIRSRLDLDYMYSNHTIPLP